MTTHASEAPLFVICYDVSDDRERRHVDRLLLGYGFRAQKSVFECRLSASERKRLQNQLEALCLKTGHAALYRVYAGVGGVVVGTQEAISADTGFTYSI